MQSLCLLAELFRFQRQTHAIGKLLSPPVKKCCVSLLGEGGGVDGADVKVLRKRHQRRSESDARGFGRMRKGLLPRQ